MCMYPFILQVRISCNQHALSFNLLSRQYIRRNMQGGDLVALISFQVYICRACNNACRLLIPCRRIMQAAWHSVDVIYPRAVSHRSSVCVARETTSHGLAEQPNPRAVQYSAQHSTSQLRLALRGTPILISRVMARRVDKPKSFKLLLGDGVCLSP